MLNKVIFILFLTTSFGQFTFAQNCDTLILKDKSIKLVNIRSENKTNYKYNLCCEGCTGIKFIDKTDVDTVLFSLASFVKLKPKKDKIATKESLNLHPLSFNIEAIGAGGFGSLNMEYLFNKNIGVQIGLGSGFGPIGFKSAIIFKTGGKKQFVPSFGATYYPAYSDIPLFTSFFGYQINFGKKEAFSLDESRGYLRINPGVIIDVNGSWLPVLPWIGIAAGFNKMK